MENKPDTQYVQHISGQGRKWRCSLHQNEQDLDWCVTSGNGRTVHHLPRSEYRLVSPPVKVWLNAANDVVISDDRRTLAIEDNAYRLPEGYRWGTDVRIGKYYLTIEKEVER